MASTWEYGGGGGGGGVYQSTSVDQSDDDDDDGEFEELVPLPVRRCRLDTSG